MRTSLYALCLAIFFMLPTADSGSSQVRSIQGTYKLMYRKLPDGTVQRPPDVMGLLTYTRSHRNFNVMWKDASGKFFSISYVATYKLTDRAYSEKSMYYMVNDEIGGTGLHYDLSGKTGTSPVKVQGRRIQFQLPLHNEPAVVFEGNKGTATRPGVFRDYWERVD